MKKKLIAILLIVSMSLTVFSCGSKGADDSAKKDSEKTEDTEETLKAEKNLLSVEVTIPATFVGDSEATLSEEAKSAGVKDITKNADGSLTMKMTKSAHKTLLAEIKSSIDDSINEILSDKENYPSLDSITYNEDVTEFNVNVDPASYGGLESMVAIAFYFEGNMYQALNAVSEDQIKTIVNFKNKDSGEIIESGDSSQLSQDLSTLE